LTLWLDDVQKQSLTFIDNDTRTITDVRLGAQGVETSTRGTLYFDDFESRRFSYIGTLPDPGVDDPQATNGAGWFTRTYQYSPTIPHAVTNLTPETGSPDTYSYDANGNMTCRVEGGVTFIQTYNAENRISTIQKLDSGTCASPGNLTAHWAFAYDGDGTRVSTLYTPYVGGAPQTSVLTAYYMGGAYEVTGSAVKKYYSVAGMLVATQDASGLQYLLTDHLGSTVAVTNSIGTLTSQQRYLPFGAPRTIPNSPILGTDFGYTGQRLLDSGMGGIMDYKARFYSPYLNRFLQPDSIIPNPANPQSWNRFSYVENRPVNLNDPSGHNGNGCFPSESCGTAENLVTMLILALVEKVDRIILAGDAINRIQEDPAFRDFQGKTLQEQVLADPRYGKSDFPFSVTRTIQFGGNRDSTSMLRQLFSPNNPEFEETRQVGRNPLSWMLRTADLSAEGYVTKDGQVTINYSVNDTFDLRWEDDRELAYNLIASGLGSVWHDGLGASEPSVNANWTTNIQFKLPVKPKNITREVEKE